MNNFNFIFLCVALAVSFSNFKAQTDNKDVSITASGSGKTLEEAKQSALRSCTEQAFGAFISSKTEMFNDEVVADQMASVSSGNIKSYEILNQDQLPNGRWGVTVKSIVSVDKLTSFVQAKGISIEIKGGLFALNIKQQLLNEQGEVIAISNMIGLLHEPMQISFDYNIQSGDPKSLDSDSKNWAIPITVNAYCNKNIDFCANYFLKSLSAISLSASDVETYKSLNKNVFPLTVNYLNKEYTFNLRKETSVNAIQSLTSNWKFYTRLFTVQTGIDELSCNVYGKARELEEGIISFPTSGELVGTYSWDDKRTLNQVEQMSGYTVKPRGVVSNFKNGGYVVYEKDGHGLVLAPYDFGYYDWNSAKLACTELSLNGYQDWHLPTKAELILIEKLNKQEYLHFGLDIYRGYYWTNDEYIIGSSDSHIALNISSASLKSGVSYTGLNNARKYKVRAVRSF